MSSTNKKKVFVSCGEMSGDLHLSYIVENMLKKDKNLEFHGIVGDKSINAGVISVNHINNNDIMGFTEVIKKYNYFKKKAYEYLEYIKKNNIESVIFVDFGGFNLKFFKLLKKHIPNIKTIYYIPPKVWAWGKNRIKILRQFDEIIVIFPFEKKYFDENGMSVKYFGNPLVDEYKFLEIIGDKILLLPGSRKQEIKRYIPVIYKLLKNSEMKNEKFILKLADKSHLTYIKEIEKNENIKILEMKNLEISFENLKDIRHLFKYCIATSGTVTFEMFLMGLPTIVVYSTSKINAFIARKILKIKYITLININSNCEIFPELLQENFNEYEIIKQMKKFEENQSLLFNMMENERKKYGDIGVLNKICEHLIKIL